MYAIDPATPVNLRSPKWAAMLKSVKWAFPPQSVFIQKDVIRFKVPDNENEGKKRWRADINKVE